MVGTCVWCATATSFSSYLGSRIINGFFCSVGQGGSLMWVKDMFFFHEHPQVINYLEFSIVLSPYLGPLVTSFIVFNVSGRWAFWVCTALASVGLILVLFMDETIFSRREIPAPRASYLSRLTGIRAKQKHSHTFIQCMMRPIVAITKVPVLLIMMYYFLNSAWVIGVNTTIGIWLSGIYGVSTEGIGGLCPTLLISRSQADV